MTQQNEINNILNDVNSDSPTLAPYGENQTPSIDKGFFTRLSEGLSSIWHKTIFPEKIRMYKERKQLESEIRNQAREEALRELQPQLKEHYKQKELDKLTGKGKSDFLGKLAKGFEGAGQGGGFERAMGMGQGASNNTSNMMGVGLNQQPEPKPVRRRVVRKAVGRGKPKPKPTYRRAPPQPRAETPEEKIKRMIG